MVDFDVVEFGGADAVSEGERAPEFTRPLVNEEFWEDTALSELLADGPVLLVFYTMDGAFPATYVWNAMRDRAWEETYDVQVVGVSISDPYAHKDLIEERGMAYRLFADPRNEVARKYGVVHDLDGMTGVEEPRPSVFLVDGDRRVQYAWVADEWPEFPDYDEVETAIADL
jgi:peroxiredoxin